MNSGETSDRRDLRWSHVAAVAFAVTTSVVSSMRWANFQYRTFDLAYYVQALWQLIHGRFDVSVEHVPLLGNHVEPIVLLFAPAFAVVRHPMLFVAIQNAALATMAPVGFSMAKRLGIGSRSALLLAVALLVTPATGYIALHEFHPEALTAPFLLLMLKARLAGRLGWHWLWLLAVLACKENMALVLAAYSVVNLVIERHRPLKDLRNWYFWPLVVSVAWFIFCTKVITPALNSGGIDYVALYSHLGNSAGEIVLNGLRQPQHLIGILWHASINGNLVWALLVPFLALPALRLRWLVIASPILLQHLLSWRSSEWTIYFHYAAPLLPLLWLGMVEIIGRLQANRGQLLRRLGNVTPVCVLLACVVAHVWLGPARAMGSTVRNWPAMKSERERKTAFISAIPPAASVMAPLPYLAHLAMREKLYSLHYILKGLKTLSRSTYEPPPPTDYVLLDYDDSATFDSGAGYYHPAMQTADGRIIGSSDQLLHNFLKSSTWSCVSRNELTLLQRGSDRPSSRVAVIPPVARFGGGADLVQLNLEPDRGTWRLRWQFEGERTVFPWLLLRLIPKGGGAPLYLTRGLCAPEAAAGAYEEEWITDSPKAVRDGDYSVEAVFVDNSRRSWLQSKGEPSLEPATLSPPIVVGELHATDGKRTLIPR